MGVSVIAMSAGLRIFLFFSFGYFVSYLFRGVNIGFAPYLTSELNLSAADLGMLTSLYFLGFALAQIPAGILLDTWGPRRVNAGLMVLAAVGTVVFGLSHGLPGLMLGRLLLGLGVAVCLGASFQAIAQTFPLARLPLINGLVMAVGGMGGVAVGAPLTALLQIVDWRTVSCGLAVLTLGVSALIFFGARPAAGTHPARAGRRPTMAEQMRGTRQLLRDPAYWRIVSLSVASSGAFYAVQSLWVKPYLLDVSQVSPTRAAGLVSVLGFAMVAGNICLGSLVRRVERWGMSLYVFGGLNMVVFMGVQIVIMAGTPLPLALLWTAYGVFGSSNILVYALLAERFPGPMLGRVNTTTNLLIFIMIFLCQIGIGWIVDLWPAQGGHYPAQAHLTAWGVVLALQAGGALWYFWPSRRAARPRAGRA